MQFNSHIFIMVFLPTFFSVYFLCARIRMDRTKWIIIIAGTLFYAYAGIISLAVFAASIILNYAIAVMVSKAKKKKSLLFIDITANVFLLLYFKYLNFAIDIADNLFNCSIVERELFLPLGISFFTFQQIMYVVNIYDQRIDAPDLSDYLAYVLYFPKLVMGPITEPKELIDQINDNNRKTINVNNVVTGIKLFSYGLFKKLVLADTFMRGVSWGFENMDLATSMDLLLVMLFYTFEIYFDFSGYTDMAIGVSKMLNIDLPINFDSPYKALSIRDFWRRWHISLTKFFTKYVYFPLGGSRKGSLRTYINIMIVFLISGLWHGASWTFILWGGLHGLFQILERAFDKYYQQLSDVVKWIYTFSIVNVLWLLFRSDSIAQWQAALYKIFTFQNTSISDGLIKAMVLPESTILFDIMNLSSVDNVVRGFSLLLFAVLGLFICLIPENNYKAQSKITTANMISASIAFAWAFMCLSNESVFVYFNF